MIWSYFKTMIGHTMPLISFSKVNIFDGKSMGRLVRHNNQTFLEITNYRGTKITRTRIIDNIPQYAHNTPKNYTWRCNNCGFYNIESYDDVFTEKPYKLHLCPSCNLIGIVVPLSFEFISVHLPYTFTDNFSEENRKSLARSLSAHLNTIIPTFKARVMLGGFHCVNVQYDYFAPVYRPRVIDYANKTINTFIRNVSNKTFNELVVAYPDILIV